jgi:Na+-driven multidrug efflux pump
VNPFGAHSSAAFGIAMRIDQLAFMPAMSIGMAVSTLTGQNIGANRYDRVREAFRWSVLISCTLTLLGTILAFSMPAQLMSLFTRDADVVAVGALYLRIVSFGYLMFAVMFASNGVVNGAGHTGATTVFTFIAFWAVRIPLAAYLSIHWGRIEGVWYGNLMGLIAGMVVSVAYYFSGRWKRPVVKRWNMPEPAPVPEIE